MSILAAAEYWFVAWLGEIKLKLAKERATAKTRKSASPLYDFRLIAFVIIIVLFYFSVILMSSNICHYSAAKYLQFETKWRNIKQIMWCNFTAL